VEIERRGRGRPRHTNLTAHVNELIESYPFGFGEFACFVEQGGLQPAMQIYFVSRYFLLSSECYLPGAPGSRPGFGR